MIDEYDPIRALVDKLPPFLEARRDSQKAYMDCYAAACRMVRSAIEMPALDHEGALTAYYHHDAPASEDPTDPDGSKTNPLNSAGALETFFMTRVPGRCRIVILPWDDDES